MESPHTARAGPLLLQDFLLIDLIYKFDRERIPKRVAKIKRGLPGFINGSRTDALADTGAAQNVVSADFAREKGLVIEGKAALFRLGNSKRVRSAGTVNFRWAFEEKPTELYDIVCHVLPECTYDFILGSRFLTATETFSKHRRRFSKCVFSMFNVFHLNFLGGGRQILNGKVGGYLVDAVPDTGAERNVISLDYAEAFGFEIRKGAKDRGSLQFADGTVQETVGQVKTTWTFTSGLKIPVIFEVLENCSAGVILGEHVLWEHDVFQTHAASIHELTYPNGEDELSDLAPFDYKNRLQHKLSDWKQILQSKFNGRTHREEISEDEALQQHENEERHRRDQWTHQYGFEGVNASPAEKEAEARRRKTYNARLEAFRRRPPRPRRDAPLISSTPTAPESTLDRQPTEASPIIPSIPTAPNATHVPPVPPSATNTRGPPPTTSTSTALVPPDNAPSNTATADQVRRGRRFR